VGRRVESERPFQCSSGCLVSKAGEGLESRFHPQGVSWSRCQLSSNDPETAVLSPVEHLQASGRQPGKPSTTSVGSPALKAGLVHLPKKVTRPAQSEPDNAINIRLPLDRLAAFLSACSFPDGVLPSSTPKNRGLGLNARRIPSTSTTGFHLASWGSAEKKDTLHFLRFKVSFFTRAHR
jgi:hypothetical protein